MSFCKKVLKKIHTKHIDTDDLGKAKTFALFSIARPHMRSFHSSWFCFFVAFTSWFGIQPLLPTVRKELKLSKLDLANSGIASVAATIAVRVFIGPLCDRFGPRKTMSVLLVLGAVPMVLGGLIKDGTGLIVLRLFIGVLGGCFVPCQFWTSSMFSPKIVGTANAIVGGWGNLGGGFTFILMPGLFKLMQVIGADEFLAWKIAIVIPAVICIITGISIIFTSDDCPQGEWKNRLLPEKAVTNSDNVKHGVANLGFVSESSNGHAGETIKTADAPVAVGEKQKSAKGIKQISKRDAWSFITVIVLILQYGMCFGIEIAVNSVMNLYLLYRFKIDGCVESPETSNNTNMTTPSTSEENLNKCSILDQETASLIASLFGLMNLFARALGGVYSDVLRKYFKLAGRLVAHFTCLVAEGIMLIIFSQMDTIPSAIGVMILFSTCVQMSEGTTYAIVPYILPRHVGMVAGLVGAGGNAGGMIWNTLWTLYVEDDPSGWFWILGIIVLIGSTLTSLVVIQQERIFSPCTHCSSQNKQYELEKTYL